MHTLQNASSTLNPLHTASQEPVLQYDDVTAIHRKYAQVATVEIGTVYHGTVMW